MFTVGQTITVTYTIPATTDSAIQSASWDISVEHPDGTVTYIENEEGLTAGVDIGATVAPTASTEGSLTLTYTPATAGLHTLVLGIGANGNFQKYDKYMINAIAPSTTANITIKLP